MKPVCRLLLVSAFALVLSHPLTISAQWNELSSTYKVETRHKVKEMIYQGKLEY